MNAWINSKHCTDLNYNRSRFAEREELLKQYQEVFFDYKKYGSLNVGGGTAIEVKVDEHGKVVGAVVDAGDSNTIIVSATGAGKTRKVLAEYFVSCILSRQSIVAHDPKQENLCTYYKLLKEMGYAIVVINLRDPMTGDRFNILQKAAKLYKQGKKGRGLELARGIAESLFIPIQDKDDMFWTESCINLFLCYFIIAAESYDPEYVTIESIYAIHIEGLEGKKTGLSGIDSRSKMMDYLNKHKGEKVYELGMPSIGAPNETRLSIFSVFTNGLARIVLSDDVSDMLTNSTFDVSDLASKECPMAIFIVTRDEAPGTYSTVVSSIVDAIYTHLIDMAQNCPNNRLPRTVHFILEEFGNIAKLNNINDMMTASRSRGIRMVVVLQSLRQLYLSYDVNVANVLIGNSKNLVYLSSTDIELIEIISKRCGTVINPFTLHEEPFIGVDRLMHLDNANGETLVLMGQNYPYITYYPDISRYDFVKPVERIDLQVREPLIYKKNVLSEPPKVVKTNFALQEDEMIWGSANRDKDSKPKPKPEPKPRPARPKVQTFEEYLEERLKDMERRQEGGKLQECEKRHEGEKRETSQKYEKREKQDKNGKPGNRRPAGVDFWSDLVDLLDTDSDIVELGDSNIDEEDVKTEVEETLGVERSKKYMSVVIRSVEFLDLAVMTVADVLGISEADAECRLRGVSRGHKVLRNIPVEKAERLVRELAIIGTNAEVA